MRAIGHWGISFILYSPVVLIGLLFFPDKHPHLFLGLSIIILTTPLPDIDLQLQKILSVEHRGITHTIWFPIFVGIFVVPFILSLLFYLYNGVLEPFQPVSWADMLFFSLLGVYGTTSHFFGDVITPTGIQPFKPIGDVKYCYILSVFGHKSKSKSMIWNIFFFVIGTIVIVLSFVLASWIG